MKRVGSVGSLMAALMLAGSSVTLIMPERAAAQCCSDQCAGDLNCDGEVTVDEIITVINSALDWMYTVCRH